MSENNQIDNIEEMAFLSKVEKFIKMLEPVLLSEVGFEPLYAAIVSGAFTVVNGIFSSWQMKKFSTFVVEAVRNGLGDRIKLNDEEDFEILNYAIDKSLSSSRLSQIRAIVKILSAKTENNLSKDFAEDLINVVSELNESEAVVLQKVYSELEKAEGDSVQFTDLLELGIPKDRLEYLLNRLVGKGLLKDDISIDQSSIYINSYQYSLTLLSKTIFSNLEYISSSSHIFVFEGNIYNSMARVVCAVVKSYVDTHPNVTYKQLKEAFPDEWAKPEFEIIVGDLNSGIAKELLTKFKTGQDEVWRFHTSRMAPEIGAVPLSDGSQVVVSNQWDFNDNFQGFIKGLDEKYDGRYKIIVN